MTREHAHRHRRAARRALPAFAGAAVLGLLGGCALPTDPAPTAGDSSTPTDPVPWETSTGSGSSSSSGSSSGTSSPSSRASSKGATPTSRGGTGTSTFPSPSSTGESVDRDDFVERVRRGLRDSPSAEVQAEVELGGTTVEATGAQDLDADALEMTVSADTLTFDYRAVDDRYFLAQPPRWVEIDPESADSTVRATLDQIQLLSLQRQLDGFLGGVTSVGEQGSEDVDGEETTRYTTVVDTERARDAVGGDPLPTTSDQLLYDVWLDEDDLIRKLVVDLDGTTVTLRADRWGEPVDIQTPDASEIVQQ
ncbi:LppX_LprAFG lipoprotein [Janibacter sp. UYMM211]|uniref:LppX_LprAFG lipoprotein n=1 Tax=Janibacter sp. UYMM211 TaxID=3156342 RepID=UPI003394692C